MGPFRIPIFLNHDSLSTLVARKAQPFWVSSEYSRLNPCPQEGQESSHRGTSDTSEPNSWKVVKNQVWDLESLQNQLREPLQLQTEGVNVRLRVSINHYSHDLPR